MREIWFTASIEAKGFGQAEDEAARLHNQLGEDTDELKVRMGFNDEKGLIRTELVFDAADAVDAHDQAFELWSTTWDAVFGEAWPMVLHITATPGLPEELPLAGVAATSADPLADLDDDEELDDE